MAHGDKYTEGGETFMEDHLNGTTWHVPDRSKPIVGKNGEWLDNEDV